MLSVGQTQSMTFDVDEISDGGLAFQISARREDFDIDQPECSLAREVEVQGTLSGADRDVYLDGKIQTGLTVSCSRCLEPSLLEVESRVTARYIPRPAEPKGSPEHELQEGEIDVEYYDENRINIFQAVHDQILLAVPLVGLCREDCRGLCPSCGSNLNQGTCGCGSAKEADPRLEILKSLKDKL